MKPFIFFSALLVAFGLLTAQAETKSVHSERGEAEIRSWLDQFIKVFTEKNVDAIMSFYTDDVVAYDIVPPLQYVGKQAYRKDYESFLAQYQGNLHVEVKGLHVDANGDLGYATGLELIGGTLTNGQKSEIWVRFTSLFRKVNGKWLDFHDHISVPTEMESGKAMLELKP